MFGAVAVFIAILIGAGMISTSIEEHTAAVKSGTPQEYAQWWNEVNKLMEYQG